MLVMEQFETELSRLAAGIPVGVDAGLDHYRRNFSDIGCTTGINRKIRAFLLYRSYAETGCRFLDWGCQHGWDACLVRMVNPHAVIDGCDITEDSVAETRAFSGMKYTQLEHTWKLPYTDKSFDRIICSGVLEHAPILNASLQELNRVTEPGGYLMITFLPNRLSYTEFVSRNLVKGGAPHRRLYSKAQLKRKLLEHGFEPVEMGYHQLLPSLMSGHQHLPWLWMRRAFRELFKLDPIAERIWPLNMFSANLYAIACKREYI